MPTAPDSNGIARYTESDAGSGGSFSALLNLGLGWMSDALTALTVGGTLKRSTDLASGVSATASAAPFQSATVSGIGWLVGTPTRATITKPGRYLARGYAGIGSTTSGTAWLRVTRAAGGTYETPRVTVANGGGVAFVPVLEALTLAAGDYVELMVLSNGTFTLFGATELQLDRINARS